MEKHQSLEADQPLDLGQDGEAQFERLLASIQHGRGFELFFCGFQHWAALREVKRRLSAMPPPEHVFEAMPLEGPAELRTIAERLAAIGPAAEGRKIVFVFAPGWDVDVRAEWAIAFRRLNERRNIAIRDCPNSIILAGQSWLPWLANDEAPDLWSVRTAVFTFPAPPMTPDKFASPEREPWRSGWPLANELESPAYYEELAAALEAGRPSEQGTRGRLLLRAGEAWKLHGEYDSALNAYTKAREVFANAGEEIMVAVAMGGVADILQRRGETDEALRIRQEEELPVYERLGDVRSRAVTMGLIADILVQRGDTDEALRIRQEEQLPVFERLGDVRERAITLGRIADTLVQRGETDEALRIRQEEQLPVYERLGDVRSRAVTMGKIADILAQRGETDEALRIRQEEQLPVFERLGDVRERAISLFKIADILSQRGETDEALTALDQSAAAFEKLKMTDEAALARRRQKTIRKRNGYWSRLGPSINNFLNSIFGE